ncbi:alpha-(1,3)-fucosyltransferase C-like [Melitaea cinxia]|uniref:alpha-(1,3)-fucosyltransferase C-like n=1 Tax=Melitaea cinxia TaxID=113334 RepID=UPI001E274106|nr:alpha-(1,3)-fucosyltransferase C-like [Melitaea cinxia]
MGVGQRGFIQRSCPFTNCFVTSNRDYFDDYTKFDVLAFHGPELALFGMYDLPERRSLKQKFVFASIESPDNYPVCFSELDNFFNWTWTYKLTSDARWGYIVVRDSNNQVIGPNVEMHWLKKEEMAPVSEEFKKKLKTKTRAAAWFVSNCRSKSGREIFVTMLKAKLRKYGLTVDVYGRCGTLSCPSENQDECAKRIAKDYYFYLSFENSYAEDYVTEKILHPLQNNAVPIVYGGANYTR